MFCSLHSAASTSQGTQTRLLLFEVICTRSARQRTNIPRLFLLPASSHLASDS